MKLLLDQNLSHKLVLALDQAFPGTAHVVNLSLETASDADIWEFAKANGFTIVTQDSDFSERVILYSYPPKVIWIRVGNTSTQAIEELFLRYIGEITSFEMDRSKGCLILW